MTLLNYTGKKVGLEDRNGNPSTVLPVHGCAKVEKVELKETLSIGVVPIFRKLGGIVRYLPKPDPNHEKFYIVTKEVAELIGDTRFDIVVGEDPYYYKGADFFKRLISI